MALALLEFLSFDQNHALFKIDIGTNNYYKFKAGKTVTERNGIDWVDDISLSTKIKKKHTAGDLFDHGEEIKIPKEVFDNENCYVQLFSFKNEEGKSPAFSHVMKVPVALGRIEPEFIELSGSFSNMSIMPTSTFNPVRRISRSHSVDTYSRQASWQDLLSAATKVALPEVLKLLSANNSAGPGNQPSQQNTEAFPLGLVNELINALLHNLAGASTTPASKTQSVLESRNSGNRFLKNGTGDLSKQFIFGIDDALLASLAGPLIDKGINILPQLLNAFNQRSAQKREANNKLIENLVSGVNNRMTQQNQPAQGTGAALSPADLNLLIQLLQQMQPAQPPTGVNVAQTPASSATTQSLGTGRVLRSSTFSKNALLSFETAEPVHWYGSEKLVYNQGSHITLKVKLNVAEPAPKNPLPKAIIKFYFKDPINQQTLFEKTFRQKDLLANTLLQFTFTKEEIAGLPANIPVTVFGEIRWKLKSGKESAALGTTDIVLVTNYFIKEQGKDVSPERELTDMKIYRPFWNKVWDAPLLDGIGIKKDEDKKVLWELNAVIKYLVLLTEQDSNGIIETKILQGEKNDESLTALENGRMKAGIELSISELNKLCSLWDNEPMLDADKLNAFRNRTFGKSNANEFVHNLKLKGRSGERGMTWIVPVFKLFDFTLNKIVNTNEAGQVTEVSEEKLRFPLPVSARILGLKSE